MGFNRRKGISAVAAIMILVVLSVVVFIAPINRSVTFWLGYSFAVLATVLTACTFMFVSDAENSSQTFLRMSVGTAAWIYFVIQMIASIEQICNFFMPYITALIVDCVITILFVIILLSTRIATEEIEHQDNETAKKVAYIKELGLTLSTIKTDDQELKHNLQRLAEDVKFSDPMSHSELVEIESEMLAKAKQLKSLVSDPIAAEKTVEELGDMLKLRNERCKMLKNKPETKPQKKDNRGVKYVGVALGIVALLASIALATVFIIVPNTAYNKAMDLYNDKKYAEAAEAFENLNGLRNSEKMVENAKTAINDEIYDSAKALFDEGKFDEAIKLFEEIKDHKDSENMIEKANTAIKDEAYNKADELLKSGDFEGAVAAFEALDGYRDSKDRINAIYEQIRSETYEAAMEFYDAHNYIEALELFEKLKDYKDSAQKIEEISNKLSDGKNTFYFGTFNGEPIEWQIVDMHENVYTMTTKKVIAEMAYNDELSNVDWSGSTLNKWLNGEFLDSFTDEQKDKIITIEIEGAETKVYVMEEKDVNRLKDSDVLKTGSDFWLRTKNDTKAMFVDKDGNLNNEGEVVVRALGVRPCIQMSLIPAEGN